MELTKELLILVGRIATVIPLLILITLWIGKRSIAEIPVFDFLIVLVLGSVVGADIADPQVSHIHTAVAVVLIGLFQVVVAKLKISRQKFERWVTFEPTVVIHNGQFLAQNMRKIRYSINNIMQMLREKDVFDIQDVQLAIIEANGKLTVVKQPQKTAVTLEDMQINKVSPGISYPLIVEGALHETVLHRHGLDRSWLEAELQRRGVTNVKDVWFASINEQQTLHVSRRQDVFVQESSAPPIFH